MGGRCKGSGRTAGFSLGRATVVSSGGMYDVPHTPAGRFVWFVFSNEGPRAASHRRVPSENLFRWLPHRDHLSGGDVVFRLNMEACVCYGVSWVPILGFRAGATVSATGCTDEVTELSAAVRWQVNECVSMPLPTIGRWTSRGSSRTLK